jgi:hypothetical protein
VERHIVAHLVVKLDEVVLFRLLASWHSAKSTATSPAPFAVISPLKSLPSTLTFKRPS